MHISGIALIGVKRLKSHFPSACPLLNTFSTCLLSVSYIAFPRKWLLMWVYKNSVCLCVQAEDITAARKQAMCHFTMAAKANLQAHPAVVCVVLTGTPISLSSLVLSVQSEPVLVKICCSLVQLLFQLPRTNGSIPVLPHSRPASKHCKPWLLLNTDVTYNSCNAQL